MIDACTSSTSLSSGQSTEQDQQYPTNSRTKKTLSPQNSHVPKKMPMDMAIQAETSRAESKFAQPEQLELSVEELKYPDATELAINIDALNTVMATINLFQDLISTQVHALNKTLSDLEAAQYPWVAVIILKSVKNRAALLKITYSSWLNAIEKFPLMTQCERWQQMLLREQKQRIELEELVKQLPKDSQMKAQITDRGQPTKYTGSYSRVSSPDEEEKSDVELLNKSRLANTKKVERDRRLDERTSLNDHQPKIKSKSTYATEPRLRRPTEDKSRSPRTDNQNSRTVREKCCMEIAQQCPNCGHILTCFHTQTPQDKTAYDTFDDNEY